MGLVVVVVAFGADVFVVDVEGIIVVLAVVGFVLILDVAEVTIELVVGCSETFVMLPRADIVVIIKFKSQDENCIYEFACTIAKIAQPS